MTRAVLYLRVSTDDQTVANQQPELERVAKARGWDVVEIDNYPYWRIGPLTN